MVDNRAVAVAQRQALAAIDSSPRQVAQRQQAAAAATPRNTTGLPDNLKAGVENLSGYSLDDVTVHYNSAKPAQLQAHAYAQGTDIHVAPGQEQHLPHEAWHVVQQKQGRVRPTMQLKGISVNDNDELEKEADVMGSKSLQLDVTSHNATPNMDASVQRQVVAQLAGGKKLASKNSDYDREGARKARFEAKAGGAVIFNNNERRLKRAPKGQHYIETDIGAGRVDRGKRRVVSLVESGTGRVLRQHNTEDHYKTFSNNE